MGNIENSFADQLGFFVTEHFTELLVNEDQAGFQITARHPHRALAYDRPVTFLRFTQCVFCAVPFGDVVQAIDCSDYFSTFILSRARADQNIPASAARLLHHDFQIAGL